MTISADLHMHSYYSDGLFPPEIVCQKAFDAGCKVVSLTDHDTLAGIAEMNAAAERLGIQNLSGIEISTHQGVEIHILGYNVQIDNPAFSAFVAELELSRRERSEKIVKKLAGHRLVIPDGYFKDKVKRELSRHHLAVALVDLGYEPDAETAFSKWLKEGCAAYVPMIGRDPKEAIERILAAGGKAVLAHPMRLHLDDYDRKTLIKRLAGWGLEGIEAIYKKSSSETIRRFRNIADAFNLFVTCGADYHGGRSEIISRFLPARTVKELQIIN